MDTREFVEQHLPAHLGKLWRERRTRFAPVGIALSIEGSGVWSVVFEAAGPSVGAGENPACLAELRATSDDFLAIVPPLLAGEDRVARVLSNLTPSNIELAQELRGGLAFAVREAAQERHLLVVFGPNETRRATTAASCTITCSADDWSGLIAGRAEPAELFFQGKLSLTGDAELALALASLIMSDEA